MSRVPEDMQAVVVSVLVEKSECFVVVELEESSGSRRELRRLGPYATRAEADEVSAKVLAMTERHARRHRN